MEIIRKAFEDGIVSTSFIGLGNVEVANDLSREVAMESLQAWVNGADAR